jgi:hypothetical protein
MYPRIFREEDFQMDEKKKVKFGFKKSSDYRIIPANGAWGGVTPRGDFTLDFFVEHNPTPDYVVHEIKPAGGLGVEVEREAGGKEDSYLITRELVGGVLLSLGEAKSLANFILEKCAEFEQEKKKKEEEEKK